MRFSNTTYDKIKWIALIFLPAFATFMAAMVDIWNLPHGAQIVGTITAIATFLGLLIRKSTTEYNRDVEQERIDAEEEAE